MNERIKRLAEQAEIYAGELIDEGADYNQYPRYYTEKLAELIVQECASLLKNSTSDKRLNLSPELFKMITNISKAQAEYICEHFGVEE
jgi:hypothetical protein